MCFFKFRASNLAKCQKAVSRVNLKSILFFIAWFSKIYLVELLVFRKCVYFILITNFDIVKLVRFNPLSVAHFVRTAESFQLSLRSNMTLILNAVAQLEKSLIAMV